MTAKSSTAGPGCPSMSSYHRWRRELDLGAGVTFSRCGPPLRPEAERSLLDLANLAAAILQPPPSYADLASAAVAAAAADPPAFEPISRVREALAAADLFGEGLAVPEPERVTRREAIRAALRGMEIDEARDIRGEPACRVCGCTDDDCYACAVRTGQPCCWFEPDLCSACALEARWAPTAAGIAALEVES